MNKLKHQTKHSNLPVRVASKRRFLELINQFKKARILVIGDFILDQFIWGSVARISPEAPVPVVHVQRESFMPGGSLNVAHNIRTLGGMVYPCGLVGRDREGRALLKIMRKEGVDTGGIVSDSGRPTSLKTRVIAHSQQVVRFDRENHTEIPTHDQKKMLQFIKQRIKQIDVVVIEDYGKGVVEPKLLKEVVRLAKKSKVPIVVDPKDKHFSYYKGVTAITPNRSEAYSAVLNGSTGAKKLSVEEVGKTLQKKLKAEAVLMTLGEDGMALFEKKGITKIPTAAREVYDVSGAGDTVIAVLAMALAAGASMREAAVLSNLSASIVVGKLGTATINENEIRKAVESNL